MKQDALQMTLLFDYYGDLLTDRQKQCFDLYYNQDLSLSEIAAETGTTRQSAHDTLTRAAALLESFEQTLGCIARDRRTQKTVRQILAAAQALRSVPGAQALADEILQSAGELKE